MADKIKWVKAKVAEFENGPSALGHFDRITGESGQGLTYFHEDDIHTASGRYRSLKVGLVFTDEEGDSIRPYISVGGSEDEVLLVSIECSPDGTIVAEQSELDYDGEDGLLLPENIGATRRHMEDLESLYRLVGLLPQEEAPSDKARKK
jgi:hypothetical protein